MKIKKCQVCEKYQNPENKRWEYGTGQWYRHLDHRDIETDICITCEERYRVKQGANGVQKKD